MLAAIWWGALSWMGVAHAQTTVPVSLGTAGLNGNGASWGIYTGDALSEDGRFVVFGSNASNLVPGDTNAASDVFVRDRWQGTTELVSTGPGGSLGNDASPIGYLCISADGTAVAFDSLASNLVAGDTNNTGDVFVHERSTGLTERISLGVGGAQPDLASNAPSLSENGRYVAFWSGATNLVIGDSNGFHDCFVRDRLLGATERVSLDSAGAQGNGPSRWPILSRDGRFVVFMSVASNLVPGDTNGTWDVFLRDRQLGATILVSTGIGGASAQGGSEDSGQPSSDGRYVVFESMAPNLVAGDTNGHGDAFVRDMRTGQTERVSVSATGVEGNGDSYPLSVSDDGRFVTFRSLASNLVAGDTNNAWDIFLRDRVAGTTERVSQGADGSQPNADCLGGQMSRDTRYVLLLSGATNLVPGDTNGLTDVFVRDRNSAGFTSLCDPGLANVLACPCGNPPSGAGRGCDNSSFTGGAALSASGVAYLATDSLVFTTSGEKPSAASVLLQGTALAPTGVVFGQGVRCLGGSLKRLFVKTASGGSIRAPDFGAGDPTISARSAALGTPIQPGTPYGYLVFYRDAAVLGGCSPLSTYNCTQTGLVAYWP